MIRNLLLLLLIGCSSFKSPQRFERKQKTFTIAWAKEYDPFYNSGNLPIGHSTPLIVDSYVYLGTPQGKMMCFDLATGRLIWSRDEKKALDGGAAHFKDSVIYGSSTGRLFSRQLLTGRMNYAIDLEAPIEAAPLVYQSRLFLHLRNHTLMALDASTGKILWSYKRAVPFTTTLHRMSTPVGHGDKVILGFADGYLASFSIAEGVLQWETKLGRGDKFIDVDVDPVLIDGKIWASSATGPLSIIDPRTGNILRNVDISLGETPLVVKDTVFVVGLNGDVATLSKEGALIKRKKVSVDALSSLALWNNHIVVSTYKGELISLDKSTLAVDETHDLGSRASSVFGHLQTKNEFLAVSSSRNRLYIFRKEI